MFLSRKQRFERFCNKALDLLQAAAFILVAAAVLAVLLILG